MKNIAGFLALVALAFSELVLASAVVTSTTGMVQAQIGTATPRPVRLGDRLNQGDTVVTGSASSVVMKFDDGQVAALTANSRMTISAYAYSREGQRGRSVLSLVSGGLRFITGLIGKNSPENVAIRAATATIGIRGTEVSCATDGTTVVCQVDGGKISFTVNGQTVEVGVGQAVMTLPNGTISQGTINQIHAQLQGSELGRTILATLVGLQGLTAAINAASPGTPTQGQGGPSETDPGSGIGSGQGSPTGPGSTGGGGGGGTGPASPS